MRIASLLFALTVQMSWANTYAQVASMTLEMKNVSVSQVLASIEKQTGFSFYYNNKLVDTDREVSISVKNSDVIKTLDKLFAGTNVHYKVVDKDVVLTVDRANAPMQTGKPGDKRITGLVKDEHGEPVLGANVVVKGTTTGSITDIDGKFSLEIPSSGVLVISYVGYLTKEQNITSQSSYTFVLVEDSKILSEVVVVGYGTQKKVNLTGAVDQVTSEVFENRPVTNISQGLVGAVPNLNIKMMDGKPNQSPQYNIRGTTSIGQKGGALILIDGVEGDPKMVNPNDIESISVLKDAASASIYGARAAYGVVLITTKAAAKGKVNITYSGNFASKSPTTLPDNMNESYPWASGFNEAWSKWNDVGTYPTAINKTMSFSQDYLAEIKRRWEDPSLPRVDVDPKTGEYKYLKFRI